MRTRVPHALHIVTAAAAAGAARAGFTPAWSYLSPALRARLAAQAGGTLYLPARTAFGYRYRSGAVVSHGILTVPFTRRVRVRQGVYRWTKDTLVWRTQPFAGACTSWASVDKTLQLSGNKVYWSDAKATAWRCVTDRLGRKLVLSSPDATAVASALDVSKKTSSVTVALAVTPTSVRRGGTVLVHGVAGGCAASDTVTILSHAFSAAHSFASVPAVYAQVGSAGRFSVKTTIPATRAPGHYGITARCGGGNLGIQATLTVTA
jgi:hypothetical protein